MENNINNILINSNYKILDIKYKNKILYDIIFQFCEDNGILILNSSFNISYISNINYKLNNINNDFKFILFSNNPKANVISLVDIIYNTYSKYVLYTINLNNNEIIISINNERIVYFNLLFSKELEYKNNFNTIKYNNLDGYDNKLLLLSNEIVLLFMTHELYNPSIFIKLINDNILTEYKKNKIDEISIYNATYIETYLVILDNIFKYNKKDINIPIINRIKQNILSDFITEIGKLDISKSIILLDEIAINIIANENIDYSNTLNFIIQNNSTSNNFNNIQLIIDIIKDILLKSKISYEKIVYNKSNIFIYNDFRLKKTNIFMITKDNKKISLINIFNSSDYELIPIIQKYKNFNIPHEFVIIRFLLLNLISSQIYDKYFNDNLYSIYINKIHKLFNLDIKYEKIFYKGIYRDEKLDKFKIGSYIVRPLQQEIKNNNK